MIGTLQTRGMRRSVLKKIIMIKLQKLTFDKFEQNALSFSKLKSLTGGANHTTVGQVKFKDFVDNDEMTKFDCDSTKYDDSCSDVNP